MVTWPFELSRADLAFFHDRFEGASPTEQRAHEEMPGEPGQMRMTGLGRRLRDVASLKLAVRRLAQAGLT